MGIGRMSRRPEPPIPCPLEPPREGAPPTHPSAAAYGAPYGLEQWQSIRKHWRRDHKGRQVKRQPEVAGQVFEAVTTNVIPVFDQPKPLQYVVEVLNMMWDLGYDGHNLQEIADALED